MNRSLKLSVLAALALGSAPALALNLGQIQVKSALDRPLVAEIPLHPDYPGEADHVEVTLAPAAAFASAGISRASLKVPLTFEVVTNAQGQKVIRVTSTQPVREPYLDFLIQVSWPKGRMLREYTVLLDPLSMNSAPGAAPAKAPPAAAPTAQPAATEAASQQAPATQTRDNVYGPVPHGDTLSHIARAHAIDGVSYQQMLIALKAFNPDAFFRDNVNALKAGAILRIPTRAQALAVERKDAIAAVRRQNQTWQDRHATTPTMVAGAGGSSTPVNGSGKAVSGNDRLHLVPPESGAASAGAAGGNGQASVSELRQDLARSKEALSSQQQAAADLKSRVAALEQIADKNKRLLGLKNAEIAELQQKLAEARKAAGLPALPASALAPPAGAGAAAASSVARVAPAAAASAAAVAPVAAASAGKMASPVAAATAAHAGAAATNAGSAHAGKAGASAADRGASASAPWYEQLWARVVLAIIIVLLIAWLVLRRRKPSGEAPKASLADHFGDSPLGHDAVAAAGASDDDEPAPVADDDGEDELLAQLAEHPDNVGLHLELASLYYARRDAGQFEGAAEAMHAYVDDESQPEWQDVVAMGRDLAPDHPLFAQTGADVTEMTGAVDDLPSEAPLGTAMPESGGETFHEVPPRDETVDTRDSDRSFDLDLAPEPPPAQAPAEPEAPADMPDESEFDALPPLPDATEETNASDDVTVLSKPEPDLTPAVALDDPAADFADDGFSDDPVDTKLDLARAYMDMGDHDGARAMLTEALNEGSQIQKDTAQKLLDELD